MTTFAYAFAGGADIFAAFLVVMFFAVVYATYTQVGTGINRHPYDRSNTDAPGANKGSEISGREGIAAMTSRGTR